MKDLKIKSLALAAVMALACAVPAFAAEPPTITGTQDISSAGGTATVPVNLDAEAVVFSVTVPTSLPVAVNAKGEVTVATEGAKIVNNSGAPVKITDVSLTAGGSWTSADYDSFDAASKPLNTKEFALKAGELKTTGANTTNGDDDSATLFGNIGQYDSAGITNVCDLTYDVKVPAQTELLDGDKLADIVFTIGWAQGEG